MQRIGFRYFVVSKARNLGIVGYVRNLPAVRSIEVEAEGPKHALEEFLVHLQLGPPRARVDRIEVEWSEAKGGYERFRAILGRPGEVS